MSIIPLRLSGQGYGRLTDLGAPTQSSAPGAPPILTTAKLLPHLASNKSSFSFVLGYPTLLLSTLKQLVCFAIGFATLRASL